MGNRARLWSSLCPYTVRNREKDNRDGQHNRRQVRAVAVNLSIRKRFERDQIKKTDSRADLAVRTETMAGSLKGALTALLEEPCCGVAERGGVFEGVTERRLSASTADLEMRWDRKKSLEACPGALTIAAAVRISQHVSSRAENRGDSEQRESVEKTDRFRARCGREQHRYGTLCRGL
jgi:hypothetical protein